MAGIMALVNQKFGRQGQANFTLYALANQQPSVFHDITVGTNDVLCVPQAPGCTTPVPNLPVALAESYGVYPAGTGYDLASGLGSLDVNALIANWNKITFLPTTTTLQLSPSSIVHGTGVNITATVAANSGTNVPTGDVNIKTTSPLPLIGTNEITLVNGSAITNWDFFPGGTYQVTAQYAGDGTFATSTSPASTLTVTPEPSTTALSLQYDYIDYSASPPMGHGGLVSNGGQVPFSSVWTFQAQASGQASQTTGDATGTATFTDGSTSATVPLNSQGIAAWSPQVLAVGSHSVSVSYSGDSSYNPSTGGPLTFTVTKGIARLSAGLETQPALLALNQPATYLAGSAAVVEVNIGALNSSVPPTGSVSVTFGPFTQSASLTAQTFSNRAASSAIFTFPNVPAGGPYSLTASYAGDANWNSSTFTSPTTYTFASGTAAATTTALSLTPSTVDSTGSVQFTVTLTTTQPQGRPPIGDVLLIANGAVFDTVFLPSTLLSNSTVSTATVTVPGAALPSGALQVVAEYPGFAGFAPSSSLPVPLNVSFTDFTFSSGVSRVLVKSGQSASVPLLLGGPNGGSTTVSFACTPSSTSLGCAVSPSTQTVTGATTASLRINAFIPGAQSSAKLESIGEKRGLLAASTGFALAFLLVLVSPRRELRRALLLSFALLALGTFAASCTTNSSPPPPPPPPPNLNAPVGSYTVLVSGSSGGITHNVKVTVVVQ
jgi:hypothetical protein